MKKVLCLSGSSITSLDDIYTAVEKYLDGQTVLYSRNLDALSDALSDNPPEKIVISEKRHLKYILETESLERDDDMNLYYELLDVFIDLEGVDIELRDQV